MDLMSRTCKTDTMIFQRVLARLLMVLGIIFTFWMGFGAQWAYAGQPLGVATAYGLFFSGGLIIVFVIGLFYEQLAALLLAIGAVGVIVWGIVSGWSGGTWGAMGFVIMLPMVVSSVLYYLASVNQKICELQGVSV